ncbi:hypothetical protein N7534_007885 [Penicillium rubens]|nr:hypothetical protein N7534_007885 [Penicillium rubens]
MDDMMFQHRDNSGIGRWKVGLVGCFSKDRPNKPCPASPSTQLDILLGSPLVCYGAPANSTGALLSGRLRIAITESNRPVVLRKLSLSLVFELTTKNPVSRRCRACATSTEELNRWDFLTQPQLEIESRDHHFNYLIPGHLPASCIGSLGQVIYFLQACAESITGEVFVLKVPVKVSRDRGLGIDKTSIRTFPPTSLTLQLVRPSVVDLVGKLPLKVLLSGVLNKSGNTLIRWRLMKLTWRIEEHQKMASRACKTHICKTPNEGNCAIRQKTRVIGKNELISGWKVNFDSAGGDIGIQLDASINPTANALCDAEGYDGLGVKHDLVIELVTTEDFSINRKNKFVTQYCATHVLRSCFKLCITERSGHRTSSHADMPPVYEDVPARPPVYSTGDGVTNESSCLL